MMMKIDTSWWSEKLNTKIMRKKECYLAIGKCSFEDNMQNIRRSKQRQNKQDYFN